jgi:hypothetical protein
MFLLYQTEGPLNKTIGGYSTVDEVHKKMREMGPGTYRISRIDERFAYRMVNLLHRIKTLEDKNPAVSELVVGKEITDEAKQILIENALWIKDYEIISQEG